MRLNSARLLQAEYAGMFQRNESTLDRLLRIGLGLGLLSLVFVGPATSLGWIGLVLLGTGLVGTCPLYRLLGIRTYSVA
jgi:hypothetical protein